MGTVSSDALSAALKVAASKVDVSVWTPALMAAFAKFDLNSPRRVAAAVGQFLVEAGSALQELSENLNYSAARLVQVFPHTFPTEADAAPYAHQPQKIGDRIYANRLGNGDVASGDGYRFCGHGLIQLTGRDLYTQFGKTVGRSAEDAAAYCQTKEGAAMSGCWYLSSRGCLPFADSWEIDAVTKRVNPAMLQAAQRAAYAQTLLDNL